MQNEPDIRALRNLKDRGVVKLRAFSNVEPTDLDIGSATCRSPRVLKTLPDNWICPACDRRPRELVRWCGTQEWVFVMVKHHDHGPDNRFIPIIICEDCNWVDGKIKRKYSRLGLNTDAWSFSVEEIRSVIAPRPHNRPKIHFDRAVKLACSLSGISLPDPRIVGSRSPSHYAYAGSPYREGQRKKIGVAWAHKDGKGFSVKLEAVPTDGCRTLRLNF